MKLSPVKYMYTSYTVVSSNVRTYALQIRTHAEPCLSCGPQKQERSKAAFTCTSNIIKIAVARNAESAKNNYARCIIMRVQSKN